MNRLSTEIIPKMVCSVCLVSGWNIVYFAETYIRCFADIVLPSSPASKVLHCSSYVIQSHPIYMRFFASSCDSFSSPWALGWKTQDLSAQWHWPFLEIGEAGQLHLWRSFSHAFLISADSACPGCEASMRHGWAPLLHKWWVHSICILVTFGIHISH